MLFAHRGVVTANIFLRGEMKAKTERKMGRICKFGGWLVVVHQVSKCGSDLWWKRVWGESFWEISNIFRKF